MGQRLNIEIVKDGEALANAYYHWSAYTTSALYLASLAVDGILAEKHHENDVINAVRILEETGALLTEEEKRTALRIAPSEEFEEATSRNEGLISITEEGMENTRDWQEGYVEVNLDSEEVLFEVYNYYEDKEQYIDFCGEDDPYEDIPVRDDIDFNIIPFSDIGQLAETVNELTRAGTYQIRTPQGEVYSFYE